MTWRVIVAAFAAAVVGALAIVIMRAASVTPLRAELDQLRSANAGLRERLDEVLGLLEAFDPATAQQLRELEDLQRRDLSGEDERAEAPPPRPDATASPTPTPSPSTSPSPTPSESPSEEPTPEPSETPLCVGPICLQGAPP